MEQISTVIYLCVDSLREREREREVYIYVFGGKTIDWSKLTK
jgi:hypothetical protein